MLFTILKQKIYFGFMVIRYRVAYKNAKHEQKQLKHKADKFRNKIEGLKKYGTEMNSYYRNSYFYYKYDTDEWLSIKR